MQTTLLSKGDQLTSRNRVILFVGVALFIIGLGYYERQVRFRKLEKTSFDVRVTHVVGWQ